MRVSFLLAVVCLMVVTAGVEVFAQAEAGHQGRNAIAALPSSEQLKTKEASPRTSSFYRQAATSAQAAAQQQTYPYPASNGPSVRSYPARSVGFETNGRFDNRLSAGAVTTTGNLRQQPTQNNAQSPLATQDDRNVAQSSTIGNRTANATASNPQTVARPPANRYASTQPTWGQPTSAYRQSAYQAPNYRTAQNCTCAPGYAPVAGYAPQGFVPANQTPTLNPAVGGNLGAPPANLQLPPAGYVQPGYGQAVYGQPAYGQVPAGYQYGQGVGTPQFGAQGARWWTPFVSGSGVYTPLLKLAPTKVGTYLGQGIIGQPTAYVDGEPLRNLLRYIAP